MSKAQPIRRGVFVNAMSATLAAAAGWCTAALIVGVTGVLIAQGHDGLAYSLGILAAAAVWALVTVPMMASAPAAISIPSYVGMRCQSPAVGRIASAILLVGLTGLLAAEIAAVQSLLRLFGHNQLALAVAVGVAAIGFLMAVRTSAQPAALSFTALIPAALIPAAIAVVLVAVMSLAYQDGPVALVSIPVMADITSLEQDLLEKRLADPATFRPHAVPFLRTSAANFIGLIACLGLGLAMLASPRPAVAPTAGVSAQQRAARAVLAVTLLIVLIPPLAAAAKRALLSLVSSGIRPSALPEWLVNDIADGAAQLCGSSVADAAALTKACGRGVGPQGFIRWHDVSFSTDAMLYAALDHASAIAAPLKIAITLLVVAAALWASRRIASLAYDAAPSLSRASLAPLSAVATILIAASLIALAGPADAVTLMSWSAAFAAAGLAPAVVAAVLTTRPSAIAVAAAMITGAVFTLALILAVRYAPVTLFAWSSMAETASPAAVRKLSNLQDAWVAAADGPGKEALRAQAERIARDGLNWFGIKPVAFGIFGLGIALLIALTGSLINSLGQRRQTD